MEYPQGFAKHLQPPVDAVIAEADIEFVKAKKRLRFGSFGNYHAVDQLIVKYVKKVFFAFAQQARQAVADGLWSGEQIRSALDDYLHKSVVNAYHQRNTHVGAVLELLESDATRQMEQDIKESNEWLEHQKELATMLKAQAVSDPDQYSTHRSLKNGRSKGPTTNRFEGKKDDSNGNGEEAVATERASLLTAYKTEAANRGIRVTDKMIAEAANPGRWNDRTPIQRWKRNYKCPHGDDVKIRAVLKKKPHLH